ncbi:hypothetical protein EDB92DRAFT_1843960 [Lactarius akahatsu]|uniref:Secreted protein n=1 Tax=Lactarius akahatsu TaxID=416441 RepID=A0AAD4LMD7_9AGAM|nr:hypothetical protein EDB92DRAFT_1843960 [Lactarius akahatsu]
MFYLMTVPFLHVPAPILVLYGSAVQCGLGGRTSSCPVWCSGLRTERGLGVARRRMPVHSCATDAGPNHCMRSRVFGPIKPIEILYKILDKWLMFNTP